MAGRGIYYTGASGPVDIGSSGDVKTTACQEWTVDSTAGPKTLRFVQSVEPQ